MWRYVGSALCALMLGGCIPECDGGYYVYSCSIHYSPYYGYYEACYPVRYKCPGKQCKGSKCDDTPQPAACKQDDDCEPGQVCGEDGNCTDGPSSSDAGVGGSPDGSPAGGMTSAGGLPGVGGAGGASSANGGSTGSGATSGDGGAASSSGGKASSTGGSTSGDGGTASSSGGSTSGDGGAAPGTGGSSTGGATSGGRIRRFNFPCIRDTQCGAGDCAEGLCFTACESDTECGTADRCAVESGRRMCEPDPNPPVRCDRSSECLASQECINGACHYKCEVDTDCTDPQDRCANGFCFPDRRPIAECVLNVECPTGLVCLDARCVDLANR